jgi:hypothetical protein
MQVLTECELRRLTCGELRSLLSQTKALLPSLPEGSLDRRIALINLRNIERELIRRDMTWGRWQR